MTDLTMRFLGHSTVRLELGGRVVLTDPVLTPRVGPLTRVVAAPAEQSWHDADLVLLSHLHGDHLHLPSLRLLPSATVLVPRGAGAWLRRQGIRDVEEIAPGESQVHGELQVTATEATHSGHRWGPRFTHGPQAPALGHLLSANGVTVYASGDTDLFPGMAELGPLDAALLPVWGWGPNLGPGHLTPSRAADAVGLLRPRLAVPVHWGTLALPGIARTARMRRLLVEPPREFAAAVAAAGHDTEVVIAPPGAEIPLPAPKDPS